VGDPRPVPAAGPRFGAVLKRFRIAAGLSQEALAERARISSDAVSTIERGVRRVPHRETVELLAGALQLSPEQRDQLEGAADRRRGPRAAPGDHESPDVDDLRPPLTPLIGRALDLTRIRELFGHTGVRLVSLTGPGGIGKTRLAIAAAGAIAEERSARALLVSLASVREARLVESAISAAAGTRARPGQNALEALHADLRGGATLLVLDNFEHVLPAASLVLDLIHACPELQVLVTSREPLRVRGEVDYSVTPLDADDAAVELFADRARAANPHFVLDESNTAAITEIARRLDCLPLAIELAAPFVRMWSPAALLERLKRPLDVLVGGPRDAPERQRTMRRTIEWSYDLLDAQEQWVFRRLAVFVENFGIEAVEAICASDAGGQAEAFDVLRSLTAKSLVYQTETPDDDALIGMLEVVREFALERLTESGELEEAKRSHGVYMGAFANDVMRGFHGASSDAWLRRCDQQIGNVRAALEWARSAGEPELGIQMVVDLFIFWGRRGLVAEARDWIEGFLAICERGATCDPITLVHGLLIAGNLATRCGDPEAALERLHRALEAAMRIEDQTSIARAQTFLGVAAYQEHDYPTAIVHHERAMPLWQALGDPYDLVIARNNYAGALWSIGALDEAAALFTESIAVARSSSYSQLLPEMVANLGYLEQHRGNFRASETLLREGLDLFRGAGDRFGVVYVLSQLAGTMEASGAHERAEAFYRESLMLNRSVDNRIVNVQCLEGLARLADGTGDIPRAIRLSLASSMERKRIAPTAEFAGHEDAKLFLAGLRERAEPHAFVRAAAAVADRSIEEIVTEELTGSTGA
jgi:predicted ATPase/DNA-binding XRE family transcriptional regulator